MDLLLKIFEVSAITVGVPLVLSILAKLFPLKPPVPTKESISFDVLQSKYGKWVLASMIPYIFFSVAAGLLLFRSLIWISHQSLPQGSANRFLMLPDHGFFSVPAMFVGLLLGLIPTNLLWRLLLKEKYVESVQYWNIANGFDTWKVTKVLAIVILITSAIFTVLIMDSYVRFTNDQIITNRFWGFGENIHNYSQVVRIKSVRFRETSNGIIESPHHVVYFSDGSIWSTRNIVYRADQNLKLSAEKEKVIIAFVAEKCGKEIERYDFLNRDEDR